MTIRNDRSKFEASSRPDADNAPPPTVDLGIPATHRGSSVSPATAVADRLHHSSADASTSLKLPSKCTPHVARHANSVSDSDSISNTAALSPPTAIGDVPSASHPVRGRDSECSAPSSGKALSKLDPYEAFASATAYAYRNSSHGAAAAPLPTSSTCPESIEAHSSERSPDLDTAEESPCRSARFREAAPTTTDDAATPTPDSHRPPRTRGRRTPDAPSRMRAPLGLSISPLVLAITVLALGVPGAANGAPPPCPPLVDVPCDGLDHDGGDPPITQPCVPGPGNWVRTPRLAICVPEQPIELREQFTFGLTRWNSVTQAHSRPTVANCMVSLSGQSIFFGTGSQSLATSASFQTTVQELWEGDGPAAPRLVQLVANGFAGLSIAVTCGPSTGCSATASAAAAGGCQSLGDASATLEPKSIGGTARYDSAQSAFRVQGDLGVTVDDSGPSMTGDVSSEISWTLHGTGAASGSASYVVRPDRTHCAYTNRPVVRRAYAAMSAAVAVTVDAGAAAAVGIATAGFDVN